MSISAEHYKAIGRVSVSFSEVEVWVSGFIWQLISQEWSVGQIITAEMSFKDKLNLLYSLFIYRVSDNEKSKYSANSLKVLQQ